MFLCLLACFRLVRHSGTGSAPAALWIRQTAWCVCSVCTFFLVASAPEAFPLVDFTNTKTGIVKVSLALPQLTRDQCVANLCYMMTGADYLPTVQFRTLPHV